VIEPQDSSGPRFSVLMAAHNHDAYVEEALKSVAVQGYRDFEIVVVDDGSTDATAARVSTWMESFRRTSGLRAELCRIENQGQSRALEYGFSMTRGSYVCLLDSDDRWLEDKLDRVDQAIAGSPTAGMIAHPLFVIGSDGRRTGDIRPKRARLSQGDCRDQLRRTGRHVAPATSGVVIRRDVLERLLPMPTAGFSFGADAYLTFGATLEAPVVALAEPLGEYRVHSEGQFLRRMLSVDGLKRSIALQRTIAGHFGLDEALRRNSFFTRNVFALAKLEGTAGSQVAAFRALANATVQDHSFSLPVRGALLAYWLACLVAPEPGFRRLWSRFQVSHTGYAR
jgi:glycosyltransferase involved in cell wall biosynthesis